jgi:hypothetical protein
MKGSTDRGSFLTAVLIGLTLFATIGLSGCQSDIGGQTLPSPYYMSDDVQYFPHPTFKLAREAAAQKAAAEQAQPPAR